MGSDLTVVFDNKVQEIFMFWANEVVQEFLTNKDECQEWHRSLSAGDLSRDLAVTAEHDGCIYFLLFMLQYSPFAIGLV
ncbi:hypothetical protein RIF29_18746 [Crotalaria pallida]|uniref:Uncharacterized protein n=1 Tax=Crotalaria pallida TaxID=3830 RepID=A0AAN9EZF9_CROPI